MYICSPSDMVTITAGAFNMGCASGDQSCSADESPLHTVTLSTYNIDKTEVTAAAYAACVSAGSCTGSYSGSGSQPVSGVTWAQATAYCAYLGRHLPTEAQWEKAARGPNDNRIYVWGNTPAPSCTLANFDGPCSGAVVAEGTPPLTAQGIYDLTGVLGNVSEWVADWYDAMYYASSATMDPQGPSTGTMRVVRGGSYLTVGAQLRNSARAADDPTSAQPSRGFRCAQ